MLASPVYDFILQVRNWSAIIGVLWSAFQGVQYVKGIKGNDLVHIQQGVENLDKKLKEQTDAIVRGQEEQTKAVVGELKELRTDIRTITTGLITPVSVYQPRVARAKKK